ncbi:PAS domain S-box protein [Dokdonella sp.]|uniref:PAS domain S-box protein n=1 Tax=Dokdonella sp. TaxID=2291710 RepID=UPI0037840356
MRQRRLPPSTDRDQLRQIVSGSTEGVILIERGHKLIWANAAACAMHGVDAAGLGRTIGEYRKRFELHYRNHHKVPPASYPLARAIAGETFADVIVEVTSVAQPDVRRVHRVRSLAITDADGSPDLYVLFLADVTDWASAEQRFEKAFGANPAPALICHLGDLRYIKVNRGFLEMTGFASDAVVGKSIYELDVLDRAENRARAIEQLVAGETIPQTQAELRIADGSSKLVVVAGQPIEFGDDPCMLFTFMDLEPRRRIEDALRHSEERFAKAFRMSPVPTLVCKAETFEIIDANEALATTTGYLAEDLDGKSIDSLGFLDTGAARSQSLARLRKTGSLRNVECQVSHKDGHAIDCLLSAESVRIDGADCLLVAMLDITHRRRSEIELVEAIEAVMKDASWFSAPLIERIAKVRRGDSLVDGPDLADLTNREREVLALIAEGLSDKAIAARLQLSPRTIRNHAAAVYSKLDVHSRAEAMVWARDRGFPLGNGAAGKRLPRTTARR